MQHIALLSPYNMLFPEATVHKMQSYTSRRLTRMRNLTIVNIICNKSIRSDIRHCYLAHECQWLALSCSTHKDYPCLQELFTPLDMLLVCLFWAPGRNASMFPAHKIDSCVAFFSLRRASLAFPISDCGIKCMLAWLTGGLMQ